MIKCTVYAGVKPQLEFLAFKKVLKICAGRAITLMKILKPSSIYSYTFGDMNSTVWAIWAAPGGEGFFFQLS